MPAGPPERLYAAFGAALRELRNARGFSQEVLAQRAEINRVYLAEIETGRRNPTLYSIARIASGLEVGLGDLLTLTDRLREPEGSDSKGVGRAG